MGDDIIGICRPEPGLPENAHTRYVKNSCHWEGIAMSFSRRQQMTFNPKRKLRQHCTEKELFDLIDKVRYSGNPEHKHNPGDFNLTPPAQARPHKTWCDEVGISKKSDALDLLKAGI